MLVARQDSGLSFDEFRRILASELQVDEERLVPEASFYAERCFVPTVRYDPRR
jgi:hypothetical protein